MGVHTLILGWLYHVSTASGILACRARARVVQRGSGPDPWRCGVWKDGGDHRAHRRTGNVVRDGLLSLGDSLYNTWLAHAPTRHPQEARSHEILPMDGAVCVLPADCLLWLHDVFYLCLASLAVCRAGLAGAGRVLLAGFLPCDLAMEVGIILHRGSYERRRAPAQDGD